MDVFQLFYCIFRQNFVAVFPIILFLPEAIFINGRIMLVFEMLKTPEEPDKWKAVEDKVGIKTVTEEEIREMLAKAGFEDIETHKKDGTTWLCAIGVKK